MMNEHRRNLDTWNDGQADADEEKLHHWPEDFTDEDAEAEYQYDYGDDNEAEPPPVLTDDDLPF